MKGTEQVEQILEIRNPWRVVEVAYDRHKRRIDVRVERTPERVGWFGRRKPLATAAGESTWRHINLGTWRCYIHLTRVEEEPLDELPWAGERGAPFSRDMSRQVAALLMQGLKFPMICGVLDIELADLWKFKHALDSGKASLSPAIGRRLTDQASAAEPAKPSASGIPGATDPVWEKLLDGSTNIDVRMLSLKLLLTKLRQQMGVIKDPDVRMLKTHEIHRYFTQHERQLGHELTQLRKAA